MESYTLSGLGKSSQERKRILEGRETCTPDNELTCFQIPKQSISFPSCKINFVPYGVPIAAKDAVHVIFLGEVITLGTKRPTVALFPTLPNTELISHPGRMAGLLNLPHHPL